MKKQLAQVAQFQNATDQPVNTKPTLLTPDYEFLRYELMREENEEYLHATNTEDLVEVLDSCVDQMYVLLGTINSHGLGNIFAEAFNLVHANNMTKVVNGKVLRDENGKIKKPEGFKPVDLSKLLEEKKIKDKMRDQQSKEALIAEAKERGYKKGVAYHPPKSLRHYTAVSNDIIYGYYTNENVLHMEGSPGLIFDNGEWAKIVENPEY